MKVLALVADHGGCGFYRIKEPARVASLLGVDIEIAGNINVEAEQDRVTHQTKVKEIHTDADLIIIQRPLNNAFTSMIEQAKRQGIATVVEMDDDFEMLHQKNMAYYETHNTPGHSPKWLREAASKADLVTVSTPALTRYGLHGRVEVLRNCVPANIFDYTPAYERERTTENTVVGWTGTVQTHPDDLPVTRGALNEIKDIDLYVVGDGTDVVRQLGIIGRPITFESTGWLEMDKYYDAIGGMDVGIVPLEMSPFNQAKSALKGLEMAALGVPFVASPTQEYERLAIHGVGVTAKGPSAWRKHVSRLVERPKERIETAKRYRETVYNEMVYERNAHGWIQAWEKAIAHRKSHLS